MALLVGFTAGSVIEAVEVFDRVEEVVFIEESVASKIFGVLTNRLVWIIIQRDGFVLK